MSSTTLCPQAGSGPSSLESLLREAHAADLSLSILFFFSSSAERNGTKLRQVKKIG